MFTGHYAPALLLNRHFPEVALWKLFVAVQAADFLFWGLVLAGVERMHIDPTREGALAMVLEFMPYSHSFLALAAWCGLFLLQVRNRTGALLALAGLSHWLLDLPVHDADLTVAPGDERMVGWGLWRWPVVAWALECGLLALAAWGHSRPVRALVAGMLVIQTLQTFVIPLPSSSTALSLLSLASYVGLAWAAGFAEQKGREPAAAAAS